MHPTRLRFTGHHIFSVAALSLSLGAACSASPDDTPALHAADSAVHASEDSSTAPDAAVPPESSDDAQVRPDDRTDAAVDDSADSSVADLPVGCLMRATSGVNLRKGPSTTDGVLEVIPSGDTVTVLLATPQAGFYNVSHNGLQGWASGQYFDKLCAPDASTPTDVSPTAIDTLAVASACFRYSWKDVGRMPAGYAKGVARVFARAVCNAGRSDVALVSRAQAGDDVHDALSWYASNYAALGMSNDTTSVDTLRHTYGHGMRESSGAHCVGRDMSATNVSSDSAEAGAWQTSWDSHSASAELPKLFAKYRASEAGCLADTFHEGVTCSAADWKNWGSGDGLEFQRLEKACPAFAAEYVAVMLRVLGGSHGHYGPIQTKAAELRPECDAMLHQVQSLVEANPGMCAAL
jgi:hypothetical protein